MTAITRSIGNLIARALLSPEKVGPDAFDAVPDTVIASLPGSLRVAWDRVAADVLQHGAADNSRIVEKANGDGGNLFSFLSELVVQEDIPADPADILLEIGKAAEEPAPLPVILADTPDLPTITASCWDALKKANDPPRYFQHGGVPCRLERDELGNPIPVELTPDRLRHELARVANWKIARKGHDGNALVDAKPPLDVMRDVLATPDPPLPALVRIVSAPVFAPDGTLQTAHGYHAAGRVYYFADGLKVPDVPPEPTADDVAKARGIILELLVDFNFVGDADIAHAVALLLLPFVRDMIDGPTPNHLIEAPSPGSGKGLLTEVALLPALGRNVGTMSEVRNDEEMRKRITALLRNGSPAIVLDNVTMFMNSGVLASALTATVWKDRLLGKSEDLRLPVRTVWVTTGNNVTMSTEIARRCVRVRLDPRCDRPWQRDGFKHPDLRGWAKESRSNIVWAALTMARAWIAAGRPSPNMKPLGSFEDWTRVIGGVLDHAGIGGFLANADEFYEQADTEGTTWRVFVARWYENHGEQEVGVKDLFPLAADLFTFKDGSERSQQIKFGVMLARQKDRVIGEYRVQATGVSHKVKMWRVVRLRQGTGGG